MALDTLIKHTQSRARSWNRDVIDMIIMGIAAAGILVPLCIYGPCAATKMQRTQKEGPTPEIPTESRSTGYDRVRQGYEETRRDFPELIKQYKGSSNQNQAMTLSIYREQFM